jgi:hypothetical protein
MSLDVLKCSMIYYFCVRCWDGQVSIDHFLKRAFHFGDFVDLASASAHLSTLLTKCGFRFRDVFNPAVASADLV